MNDSFEKLDVEIVEAVLSEQLGPRIFAEMYDHETLSAKELRVQVDKLKDILGKSECLKTHFDALEKIILTELGEDLPLRGKVEGIFREAFLMGWKAKERVDAGR